MIAVLSDESARPLLQIDIRLAFSVIGCGMTVFVNSSDLNG